MNLPATRIRRLRARVRKGQDVVTRHALERLLVSCDRSENQLPPGVILCIREVRDPLPGALQIQGHALVPPTPWRDALDRTWRHFLSLAVRPSRDPNASSSPAVWFSGESELLACLANSALRGRLHSEWWWPCLLRPDEGHDWTLRWRRRPGIVPWALQCLAETGELASVLAAIAPNALPGLLETLEAAHNLTTLPSSVPRPDPAGKASTSDQPEPGFPLAPSVATLRPNSRTEVPDRPLPVWAPLLPALDWAMLPSLSQQWAVVGLLLVRAPHLVRQTGFAQDLQDWMKAVASVTPDPPAVPPRAISSPPAATSTRDKASPSGNQASRPLPDSKAIQATPPFAVASTPKVAPPSPDTCLPATGALATEASESPATTGFHTSKAASPHDPGTAIGTATGTATFIHPLLDSQGGWFVRPHRFRTELGGSFYLLNVALALHLYADFTEPRTRGLDLSPWDLLALLGSRVAREAFEQDPIAAHIAQWAGRSAVERPGERFNPPPEDPGRSDILIGDRASLPSPSGTASPLEPPKLRKWLDRVIQEMEGRLSRAIPAWADGPLLPRLIRQRAWVETFDSTIQVRFRLADHPVVVRLAGLDRDPGWIPAAGRTVQFFYDDDASSPSDGPVQR